MSDALPYPDTKFITIIRDPAKMYESLYKFKQYASYTHMNYTDFVGSREGMVVDEKIPKVHSRIIPYIWNPMLYEMGIEYPNLVQKTDEEIIDMVVYLDEHLDLVLISDRIDESLVLLKELLCCDWDDVVVLRKNERRDEVIVSEALNRIVRQWNHGDQLMYDYFLQRLERKIDKYGRDRMERDVQILRDRTQALKSACIKNTVMNSELKDRRLREYSPHVYTYELKDEQKHNKTCLQLVLPELKYRARLLGLYKKNLPKEKAKLFDIKPGPVKGLKNGRPAPVHSPKSNPSKRNESFEGQILRKEMT